MLNLFTVILITFMLTACVTDTQKPSPNSDNPNQCPTASTAKINNTPIQVNTPNPFDGLVNPGMSLYKETLTIGLITKEVGLLELSDFAINNLHTGIYSGDQFTLNLFRNDETCQHDKKKSKFIIEQYDTADGKLKGCFISKFDCTNEIIEISTNILGIVY